MRCHAQRQTVDPDFDRIGRVMSDPVNTLAVRDAGVGAPETVRAQPCVQGGCQDNCKQLRHSSSTARAARQATAHIFWLQSAGRSAWAHRTRTCSIGRTAFACPIPRARPQPQAPEPPNQQGAVVVGPPRTRTGTRGQPQRILSPVFRWLPLGSRVRSCPQVPEWSDAGAPADVLPALSAPRIRDHRLTTRTSPRGYALTTALGSPPAE